MLNQLRNSLRSWLAGVLIALLVVSFAVWGISDIFRGGGASNAVATIGDARVSTQEFASIFRRVAQNRGVTEEEAVAQGLDQQLLTQLVRDRSFEEAGRELGLTVADELVARQLRLIDAFRNPITGAFDPASYRAALADFGETPERFEASIRNEILRNHLQSIIVAGVSAPAVLSEQRAAFDGERRRVAMVRIPPEAAGAPAEPTEDELRAYYEENAEDYISVERRSIALFLVELEQVARGFEDEVDDELLRNLYDERRALLGTPERRDVVELSAPDEATAADIAQRLNAGEAPDAIAEALGLAAPNVYDDAADRDIIDPNAAATAFSLDADTVSAPFRGAFSWMVVQVGEVTPGDVPPYESVEPLLRYEAAREAAAEEWIRLVTDFDRLRDRTGATLEEAAAEVGAPALLIAPFDAEGVDASGYAFDLLTARQEILARAFDSELGLETNLEPVGDEGYFALRVDDVLSPAPRPFEDVRDQVREDLLEVRRDDAITALSLQAREALEGGADAETAAAAIEGAAPAGPVLVRGLAMIEGVDPLAEEELFAAAPGAVVIAVAQDGGRSVARLEEIIAAEDVDAIAVDAARGRVSLELAEDLAALYQAGLLDRYEVRAYPDQLARATGVSPTP